MLPDQVETIPLMGPQCSTSNVTSTSTSTSTTGSSLVRPGPTLNVSVLEFRLKHGLCHGCGTRIYQMSTGSDGDGNPELKPLTIQGVVLQGRCLFCYPPEDGEQRKRISSLSPTSCEEDVSQHCSEQRKRYKLTCNHNNTSNNSNQNPIPPPRFVKQELTSVTDENDSLTATGSSVARLPSSAADSDLGDGDQSVIDLFSQDDSEHSRTSTTATAATTTTATTKKPPVSVDDYHSKKDNHATSPLDSTNGNATDPQTISIRDFERLVYTGTITKGTASKGTGIFRHLYKKGEFKGKEAVYEGQFENGRLQGQGKSEDPQGCVYTGAFYRGAAHGYGTCTWSNAWRYEGEWVMDQREGKGTLRQLVDDGEVYQGEWKQDQWHGKGTLKFAGGGQYVGDFRKHKLHGHGKYEFADKSVYEGSFKDDLRVGLGTMTYEDGSQYVGEWKNNWREGKGTMFYKDGSIFKGVFRGDEKVSGVLHLPDGIMRREVYVNGELQS